MPSPAKIFTGIIPHMFAFLPVRRFLAGVLSLRYYGILGNDARHKRSIKIVSRLASPLVWRRQAVL